MKKICFFFFDNNFCFIIDFHPWLILVYLKKKGALQQNLFSRFVLMCFLKSFFMFIIFFNNFKF